MKRTLGAAVSSSKLCCLSGKLKLRIYYNLFYHQFLLWNPIIDRTIARHTYCLYIDPVNIANAVCAATYYHLELIGWKLLKRIVKYTGIKYNLLTRRDLQNLFKISRWIK